MQCSLCKVAAQAYTGSLSLVCSSRSVEDNFQVPGLFSRIGTLDDVISPALAVCRQDDGCVTRHGVEGDLCVLGCVLTLLSREGEQAARGGGGDLGHPRRQVDPTSLCIEANCPSGPGYLHCIVEQCIHGVNLGERSTKKRSSLLAAPGRYRTWSSYPLAQKRNPTAECVESCAPGYEEACLEACELEDDSRKEKRLVSVASECARGCDGQFDCLSRCNEKNKRAARISSSEEDRLCDIVCTGKDPVDVCLEECHKGSS